MTKLAEGRVEATIPTRKLDLARAFYEDRLGLNPVDTHRPDVDVIYACGAGTRMVVYEHPTAWTQAHTVAHFAVADVHETVRELRGRGVEFEQYDLPELHMVDGVATVGDVHFAWFRDADGNILGIHD